MTQEYSDHNFTGSIPEIYESCLVPLIFEPYAKDLARRLSEKSVSRVLEIAAGTGVVTRAMDRTLAPTVCILATDLNPDMLSHAAALHASEKIGWRQADALALPFNDEMFDAVVCQFGVMFFPDRVKAYSEARRVLRRGGYFIFNVWDRIEENEFADVVTESLAELFPSDPPRFLARTPHGYADIDRVLSDLGNAGFTSKPEIETLSARSIAANASIPAIAYCQGTPLCNEILVRAPFRLAEATDFATAAIAQRFGRGEVNGKIQAHIINIAA